MGRISTVGKQIRHYRKAHGWTQAQLAEKLGLKRSALGAYEEGRSEPRLETLVAMAQRFEVSIDTLVIGGVEQPMENAPRILAVPVDRDSDAERIAVVPHKAAAGYTQGFADPEWMEGLEHFSLPFPEIPQYRTLRMFQIEGDSMLPVPSGSYILGSFVESLEGVGGGRPYIVVTQEDGMVFKRIDNQMDEGGELMMISNNPLYEPYPLAPGKVVEVWRAIGYFSTEWPEAGGAVQHAINALRDEVRALKLGAH
jgi:transcriptional regulator with XRE-family HTH domain